MAKNTNHTYKIIFIVIVIILLAIGIYGYKTNYQPKHKKETQVTEYKQDLYNSLVCEYNCPLSVQQIQNKTQLLPEISCVKDCTLEFKQKWARVNISKQDLSNDNLIVDLSNAIEDCKKESLNMTTFKLNNSIFFQCTIEKLDTVKEDYTYLN